MSEQAVKRLADHDNNEERHYLREGPRLYLTWSWLWLHWGLGPNLSFDPYSDERWSVWLVLGPLCIEAYWRSGRGRADG